MQFLIHFSGEVSLPMAYQHAAQSMLYAALGAEPEYQAFLHDSGKSVGGRSFKLFTFGRLEGRFRAENGLLNFKNGLSLEVRSPDPQFIRLLCESFRAGTVHTLCGTEFSVARSELSDRRIIGGELEVEMLSPVTVYTTLSTGKTVYFSPDESDFYRLIAENAERKWRSVFDAPPPGEVSVETIGVTPRDKVVTKYKGTLVTAWMGEYRLSGPPALLDLLYNTGLGAKSSQGFGMFELI